MSMNPEATGSSGDGNGEKPKAEILQAMFQHYANVGLDHQRQSATTSNILLVIAGAILTVIGLDKELNSVGDAIGAAAVAIIGAFGMVWSWKQHETYKFWTNLAEIYQGELLDSLQGVKTASELRDEAEAETAKEFGRIAVYRIHIRYLWVALHAVVMLLGIVLAAAVLYEIEGSFAAGVAAGVLIALMILILTFVIDVFGAMKGANDAADEEE